MQPVITRRIAIVAAGSSLPPPGGSARVFFSSSVPSSRPSLPSTTPQPLSQPKQTPPFPPRQPRRAFSLSAPFRQEATFESPPPSPPPPKKDNNLPPSGVSPLPSRSLISLSGPDAAKFLRGIITNELPTSASTARYAAFLSAQGRILYDAIIYLDPRASPDQAARYLVEVSTPEAANLVKHLKRYKLRSKCDISLLAHEEASVFAVWGNPEARPEQSDSVRYYSDPRVPGWERGLVFGKGLDVTGLSLLPEETYHLVRYSAGVAEGQGEIIKDGGLPHESNMDLLGGVDFRKGCYVGQELTIRTEHRGVVRKRILPAVVYTASAGSPPTSLRYEEGDLAGRVEPGSNVTVVGKKGRPVGKWLGGRGNLGLVLGRLEKMTDLKLPGEGAEGVGMGYKEGDEFEVEVKGGEGEKVRVKAFVPAWLREKLEEKMEKKGRRE
ncbi:putative mitochondrial transferase CAF17 precursor [Cercophora samala]|uniref:Iron-sulfur cluster assembly factor IBA57 homolog, mitochondrial n=1 Tax=Cercophora samala TaxID=330535 RepID=A0AA39ZCX5_9PEZI|nr:putative mitochondrial transferase CAF17 precursor [Cercophora samala]